MGLLYNLQARASTFLPSMILDKNENTENSPPVLLTPSSSFLPALPSFSTEEAVTGFKQKVQNGDFHRICRICRVNVEMGVTEQRN